ncbi:type IV pilus biogenesis/stability protein PilW [Sporosarcina sp. PTS2304]|uniref:tetratricopeptide repeat protein n=1 Tax=Sporosarcina sp. PTS2304 TaxID=2283194 RepID=UPI0013B3E5EC|nr:tetratricopeptide repeat protein [Sporosarcina sp. PTS2304]
MTNRSIEEIPASPSLADLPGDLVRLVASHIDQVPRRFPKNEFILICKNCRKRGRYDIGHIMLDVDSFHKNKSKNIEHYVQLSAYFRCKHCNSSGPWGFVHEFKMFITSQLLVHTITNEESELFSFGENRLYDGSSRPYSSHAEEHLLKKIVASPSDAFLWNRLGNLYDISGRPELATAAFERSLSLDPLQTESNYSLGNIIKTFDHKQAVHYYHRMIISAHYYDKVDARTLRTLLASTLCTIMHLQQSLLETFTFTPSIEDYEKLGVEFPPIEKEQSTTFKGTLDVNDLKSFYPIAEFFMGDRKKELRKEKGKKRHK